MTDRVSEVQDFRSDEEGDPALAELHDDLREPRLAARAAGDGSRSAELGLEGRDGVRLPRGLLEHQQVARVELKVAQDGPPEALSRFSEAPWGPVFGG